MSDWSGPFRITLPSGKVVTESIPAFDAWPDRLFPQGAAVFVAKGPGGAVRGVFTLAKTKLHGPAATLYDNGHLEMIAFYADHKLQGSVQIWTDQKERLFYAEYKNGDAQGLVCLFRGRLPWLVQEWNRATLEHEYLVQCVGQSPTVLPTADVAGSEAAELVRARQRLTDLQDKIESDEREFKRKLADWLRKEDQKAKQRRIPQMAPARRPGRGRQPSGSPRAATAGVGHGMADGTWPLPMVKRRQKRKSGKRKHVSVPLIP